VRFRAPRFRLQSEPVIEERWMDKCPTAGVLLLASHHSGIHYFKSTGIQRKRKNAIKMGAAEANMEPEVTTKKSCNSDLRRQWKR
jgi:hypothetical protein